MKKTIITAFIMIISTVLFSCLPFGEKGIFLSDDRIPPVFLGAAAAGPDSLIVKLNEKPDPESPAFLITPDPGVNSIYADTEEILITLARNQDPGHEYILEGTVKDSAGNSLSFVTRFYGFNPDLPEVKINEFTTQGSSSHPDMAELVFLSDGNLAGMSLFHGTDDDFRDKKIFPPVRVSAGDFALVHFKPQGIPEEIDETEDKSVSGGIDAADSALDFWIPGGSGLSGNNGVLALYSYPGGPLIDAVIYSNRTSSSDEKYRGFGSSSMLFQVDRIVELGGWRISGTLAAPEDAVNPDDSTATRSICRNALSGDNDEKQDWHIVPTSGYTFGFVNNDEIYSP